MPSKYMQLYIIISGTLFLFFEIGSVIVSANKKKEML